MSDTMQVQGLPPHQRRLGTNTTIKARGNSCTECRRRKQKCDQGRPCSNCTRRFPQPTCEYNTKRNVKRLVVKRNRRPPLAAHPSHLSSTHSRPLCLGADRDFGAAVGNQQTTLQLPHKAEASTHFPMARYWSAVLCHAGRFHVPQSDGQAVGRERRGRIGKAREEKKETAVLYSAAAKPPRANPYIVVAQTQCAPVDAASR